jgi:hypothetical protein
MTRLEERDAQKDDKEVGKKELAQEEDVEREVRQEGQAQKDDKGRQKRTGSKASAILVSYMI